MVDTRSQLAVITPSYAPDAEMFADLHRSVLEHTSETTVHHVIAPKQDVGRFAHLAGNRCRVWTVPELLASRYHALPRDGWWVNSRRPWPPVRGWVLQQALKIGLSATLDADVVVLADSDVVLVRQLDAERLLDAGTLVVFRVEGAVHADMDRHIRWHAVARDLLGLPAAPAPPLPDYISPLNVWSPQVVRAMLDHIESVRQRPWLDMFTRQLHVSEFILYGVFVDEIWSRNHDPAPTAGMLCHDYWDRTPMDECAAIDFAERLPPEALGIMISAKSGTVGSARRAAISRCAAIVRHKPASGPTGKRP